MLGKKYSFLDENVAYKNCISILLLGNSGLQEGLTILQAILENLSLPSTPQQASRHCRSTDRRVIKMSHLVKLHTDYNTMINANALATAITYGKVGSKKSM